MNDMDKRLNLSLEQQWGTVIIWLAATGNISNEIEELFCDLRIGQGKDKEKDFFQTLVEINQSQKKPTDLNQDAIDTIIFDLTNIESIYSAGITPFLKAHRFLLKKNIRNKVILLNLQKKAEKTLKTSQLINPDQPKESIFDIRTGTQQDILSSLQSQSE